MVWIDMNKGRDVRTDDRKGITDRRWTDKERPYGVKRDGVGCGVGL